MLSGILLFYLKKKEKLAGMVTRWHSLSVVVPLVVTLCHALSLVVTRCHSLSLVYHSLSLVVPLVVIRCHSLSFTVTRCTTRCHSLPLVINRCHSLSHDVPLVCLFINDLRISFSSHEKCYGAFFLNEEKWLQKVVKRNNWI